MKKRLFIVLCVSLGFYLCGAFIVLDINWMYHVTWTPGNRELLLIGFMMMFLLSVCINKMLTDDKE